MSRVYGQIDGVDVVDGATTVSDRSGHLYRYADGIVSVWRGRWESNCFQDLSPAEQFATPDDIIAANIPTRELDHDPKLQAEVARARGETADATEKAIQDAFEKLRNKPLEYEPMRLLESPAPLPYGVYIVSASVAFGVKGGE